LQVHDTNSIDITSSHTCPCLYVTLFNLAIAKPPNSDRIVQQVVLYKVGDIPYV